MAKFISVKSVAERYGVSVPTVWYWVKNGILPKPYKLGRNTTRWSIEELDKADNTKMEKGEINELI